MSKKKYIFFIAFAVLVLIVCAIFMLKNEVKKNGEILSEKIVNVSGDLILDDIVPYEWEKAYSFKPYTDKKDIESIIGFSDGAIKESTNDNYVNIILVNKNKVVAVIYGEQEDIGYNIVLNSPVIKGEHKVLHKKNEDGNVIFTE